MRKKNNIMFFMYGVIFAAVCCACGFRLAACQNSYMNQMTVADVIVSAPAATEDTALDDWEILQMAMMKTESGFDPSAVGSSNDRGVLQITPIYVKEVNRLLGEDRYTHDDAFSVTKSIEMFNIMQSRKNPRNDMARAMNGHNPGGSTIGYPKKIKDNIEFIKRMETARAEIIRMRSNNI